jgi:ribonuclease BN (tRNA processing enzyme)
MADNVTLYPLGVGDAFTERFWYSTMLLDVDGRQLFIDAPAYLPKMLAENNRIGERQVTIADYREVLITHMHADHTGGIEELAYLQYFATDDPLKLYAPKWLLQDIWSSLRPAMEESARGDDGIANLDWFFTPVPIGNPHDLGGFTVEHRFVSHYPRTVAYKFDFGNAKLGFSSDTGFDRDLIEWLDDCDTVLHECRFGPTDVLGGDLKVLHTSIADLLTLPESFQEKTLLYHYADDAFGEDPEQPSYDIGGYRLLKQNHAYDLLQPGAREPEAATAGS